VNDITLLVDVFPIHANRLGLPDSRPSQELVKVRGVVLIHRALASVVALLGLPIRLANLGDDLLKLLRRASAFVLIVAQRMEAAGTIFGRIRASQARSAKLIPSASQGNRAGGIRTHDLLNPIQAHYQAVLRPEKSRA
jgi:hypothetical protein